MTPTASTAGTVAMVDTTRGVIQAPIVPTANIPRLSAPRPTLEITSGSSGSSYQQSQRKESLRSNDYRSGGKETGYQWDYSDLPMDIRFAIPAG